ncbi:MAG: superoxide dismutase family protein [Sulfitobacter sp.]
MIQDDDGAAFIIHSGADDYESQPSGDAGSRVACGAFEAS